MNTATTVDISGFTRGLTGFVDRLGIEAPIVLKKEMGELVKTLVRTTPGADVEKLTTFNEAKFAKVGDAQNSDTKWAHGGGKVGASGILWYAVDRNYLSGVAPQDDKRDATPEELEKLSWRITKGGRLNLPIKGHKHQHALIWQTILTKRSTLKKMIAIKIKNRGRLKAGWLVAVAQGKLVLTGGNQPPQWVKRHMDGVHGGYAIDATATKNFPSFTIANTAKGVGNRKLNLNWIVQKALNIRAKAMSANLALFMRGKKHLSDYAR